MPEAQKGLWASINKEATEMPEKITFDINIVHTVKFADDFVEPREVLGDEGPYLIFDVVEQDEKRVIMTSAWTLLSGLKKLEPLAGKTIQIVKKLAKGKQYFEIVDMTNQAKLN